MPVKTMKPIYSAIPALTLAIAVLLAVPAFAQTSSTYSEYSVKFVCGTAPVSTTTQEVIQPGEYSTAINVHNPNMFSNQAPLTFLKKAVIANGEGAHLVPPSAFRKDTLPNDYAETIQCGTIRGLLGGAAPPAPAFFEGFVVFIVPPASTPNELDVTTVYSSSNNGPLTLQVRPTPVRIYAPPANGATLEGKVE